MEADDDSFEADWELVRVRHPVEPVEPVRGQLNVVAVADDAGFVPLTTRAVAGFTRTPLRQMLVNHLEPDGSVTTRTIRFEAELRELELEPLLEPDVSVTMSDVEIAVDQLSEMALYPGEVVMGTAGGTRITISDEGGITFYVNGQRVARFSRNGMELG
jgi:hypothetical protein